MKKIMLSIIGFLLLIISLLVLVGVMRIQHRASKIKIIDEPYLTLSINGNKLSSSRPSICFQYLDSSSNTLKMSISALVQSEKSSLNHKKIKIGLENVYFDSTTPLIPEDNRIKFSIKG